MVVIVLLSYNSYAPWLQWRQLRVSNKKHYENHYGAKCLAPTFSKFMQAIMYAQCHHPKILVTKPLTAKSLSMTAPPTSVVFVSMHQHELLHLFILSKTGWWVRLNGHDPGMPPTYIVTCTEDPLPQFFPGGTSFFVCGSETVLQNFPSQVGTQRLAMSTSQEKFTSALLPK